MNQHFAPRMNPSPVELARQPDFDLGGLRVRPSVCEVEWAGTIQRLEPRVMQVLVSLARADGEVMSRDDLISSCWAGRVVGEDAINRCVGRLRRLFEASGGPAAIITVPRVGYRLEVRPDPELASEPPPQDEAKAEVEPGPRRAAASKVPAAPALRWRGWAGLGLVAVLGCGLAALWATHRPSGWTLGRYRPFAAETLIERHPAFSPDGEVMAYSAGADVEGRRIFTRAVRGGAAVRVSEGPGDDYAPAWSPDGTRLAYARRLPGRPCAILVRRLPAGPESLTGRCMGDERTKLAWSPDGGELFFTDSRGKAGSTATATASRGPTAIWALDLATGRVRALTRPSAAGAEQDSEPVVSPDGRRLAFLRDRPWGDADLMTLALPDGALKRIATPGVRPGGVAWTPDSRGLLVGSDRAGDFSLWLVPADGGGPRRLLTGLRAIGRIVASRSGLVALETDNARVNLFRYIGASGAGGDIAPANSSDWSPDFAADGSVAFISDRGGGKAVWVLRPGQGVAQAEDLDFDHLYGVRWSPDGRRIAFVGARNGAAGLYIADAGGAALVRLQASALDFGAPAWSGDGRALIVPARDARGWRLVSAPLDRGAAARTVSDYGWVSIRAGREGLFGLRADVPGIWRIGADGRRSLAAPEVTAARPEDWALSGGRIYTLRRGRRGEADIYVRPAAGGPARLIGRASAVSEEPGLAVDPLTGAPVFPRIVTDDTDIGLMTLGRTSAAGG